MGGVWRGGEPLWLCCYYTEAVFKHVTGDEGGEGEISLQYSTVLIV